MTTADSDTQWRRHLQPTRQREDQERRVVHTTAPWASSSTKVTKPTVVDVASFPSLGSRDEKDVQVLTPRKSNAWGSTPAANQVVFDKEERWPNLSESVPKKKEELITTTKPKKQQQPNANPNKPKPQKSYSILDAVVIDRRNKGGAEKSTNKIKAKESERANSAAIEKNKKNAGSSTPSPLPAAMTEENAVIIKKKKEPKKRVLSSLKKRLLLERLEEQRILEEEAEGEGILRWLNLATPEELEDEMERDEIFENVIDMCAQFVHIPVSTPSCAQSMTKDLQVTLSDDNSVIQAKFPTLASAVRAYRGLRGRILGGERLKLEVMDTRGLIIESAQTDEDLAKQQLAQEIRLVDVLDDEDDTEDEESINEILADLSDLVASRTGLAVSKVELILASRDAVVELDQVEQRAVAAEAVASLQAPPGLILGGRKIEARLNERSLLALRSVCDDDCLEDNEEVEEIQSDLMNICRRRLADACAGGRGDFVAALAVRLTGSDRGDVWLETKLDADLAKTALEGLVLGGKSIHVDILNRGDAGLLSLALEDASLLGEIDSPYGSTNRDAFFGGNAKPLIVKSRNTGKQIKIPAKYAAAHLVLQKSRRNHRKIDSKVGEDVEIANARIHAISSHARFGQQLLKDSSKSIVPLDGELDSLTTALLRKLYDFQERVRVKEPTKFKLRRRLVFGLREVKRGTACNNIKLIFLAPNIEASQGIDSSISAIIDAAKENDIPVIFTLTKRRLGAAFSKVVNVSAVGVYSADGAYEEFKSVIKRHKHIIAHPDDAIEPLKWFKQQNMMKNAKKSIDQDNDKAKKTNEQCNKNSKKASPSSATGMELKKVQVSSNLVATAPAYTPPSGLVATAAPYSPLPQPPPFSHAVVSSYLPPSTSPHTYGPPFSASSLTAFRSLPNVDAAPFIPQVITRVPQISPSST